MGTRTNGFTLGPARPAAGLSPVDHKKTSAGAIGSDCRCQEVCIYVSALPFSREEETEREAPENWRNRNQKAESLATVFWTLVLNGLFVLYDLLVVRFLRIKRTS